MICEQYCQLLSVKHSYQMPSAHKDINVRAYNLSLKYTMYIQIAPQN
jgi:hypothetical protein